MKTLSIAAMLAVATVSIAPAFATEEATIHGRSEFALVSALHDRGVDTTGVEAWGDLILAWVPNGNGNGGSTMVFFDPDNLQQVNPNRG